MKIRLSEKLKLNIEKEYSVFIDKYIEKLPAEHSAIYLCCVKKSAEKIMDTKDISALFGKDENDIIALFRYLSLLNIAEITDSTITIKGNIEEASAISLTKRPEYDIDEISYAKKANPEIKLLIEKSENILNRMLSYNDLKAIYSYYDFYRLPVDVILTMLDYCSSRGKHNLSYIEKIALDWAERNIDSVEKAEKHLETFNSENIVILKAMGIQGRTFSTSEAGLIEKWKKEYGYSIDMILLACEKKANFKYADKILENWYKKGIKTVEEAKKESEEYSAKQQKEHEKKKTKNQFTDFSNQRKYDHKALEKMMFKKHKSTEDK